MIAFLRTLASITISALQQLAGGSDRGQAVPSQNLQNQALQLGRELSRLTATAAPLRRSPGALGPDGIERRLTAFASLSYQARHLVIAAQAGAMGPAPMVTAADASKYSAVIAGNTLVLIRMLDKHVPDGVPDSQELPETIGPGRSGNEPAIAARRELQRINEALLVLAEDLASGRPGRESATEEAANRQPRLIE